MSTYNLKGSREERAVGSSRKGKFAAQSTRTVLKSRLDHICHILPLITLGNCIVVKHMKVSLKKCFFF